MAAFAAAGGLAGALLIPSGSRWRFFHDHILHAVLWSALVLSSLLVSFSPASGSLRGVLLVCLMAAVWSFLFQVLHVASKRAVGLWGHGYLRSAGPAGRIGASLGALAGAAVPSSGLPMLTLAFVLPLMFVSPALLSPHPCSAGSSSRLSLPALGRNLAFALAGYGPLTLHVAFVASTAGAAWAGVSMAVYAASGLLAPPLSRLVPASLLLSPLFWLALSSVSNLGWLLTLVHPLSGVLLARSSSAVLLFLAEGSADVDAYENDVLSSAVSGRLAGGLVAGAAGTYLLYSGASVAVVASCFFALGLLLMLAGTLRSRRA